MGRGESERSAPVRFGKRALLHSSVFVAGGFFVSGCTPFVHRPDIEPPPPVPWKPEFAGLREFGQSAELIDEQGFFRIYRHRLKPGESKARIQGIFSEDPVGIAVYDAINKRREVDLMVPLYPGGEPVDGVGYFAPKAEEIYDVLNKLNSDEEVPEALESPSNCAVGEQALPLHLTTWEIMLANGMDSPNIPKEGFLYIPLSQRERIPILEEIYGSPIVGKVEPDVPPVTVVVESPPSPTPENTPIAQVVDDKPTTQSPPTLSTRTSIEEITPVPISMKCGGTYPVTSERSLSEFARGTETTWQRIAAANNLRPPFTIHQGDRFYIPCDGEQFDMSILTPTPPPTTQPTSTAQSTATGAPTSTVEPTATTAPQEVKSQATPIVDSFTPTPVPSVPEVQTKKPSDLSQDVLWEEHEIADWIEAFDQAARDGRLPENFNPRAFLPNQSANVSTAPCDFVRSVELPKALQGVAGTEKLGIEFRGLGLNGIPDGSHISAVARAEATKRGIEVGYTQTLFGYPAMVMRKGKLNYMVIYPPGDTPDSVSGQAFNLCGVGCESAISTFVDTESFTYESWVAACRLDCGNQTNNQTFQAIVMAFWDKSEEGLRKVEYIR